MPKKKAANSDVVRRWVRVGLTFSDLDGPIGCRTMMVNLEEYAQLVAESTPMNLNDVSAAIEVETRLRDKMMDPTVPVTHWQLTPYCWPAEEEQPAA